MAEGITTDSFYIALFSAHTHIDALMSDVILNE